MNSRAESSAATTDPKAQPQQREPIRGAAEAGGACRLCHRLDAWIACSHRATTSGCARVGPWPMSTRPFAWSRSVDRRQSPRHHFFEASRCKPPSRRSPRAGAVPPNSSTREGAMVQRGKWDDPGSGAMDIFWGFRQIVHKWCRRCEVSPGLASGAVPSCVASAPWFLALLPCQGSGGRGRRLFVHPSQS